MGIMQELMAEISRVNKLELEVERTIDTQKKAVREERVNKAKSMGVTLNEFRDALIEADAMRKGHSAFFVLPGVSYKEDDGYDRSVGIIFYTDGIFAGNYYPGSGCCNRVQRLEVIMQHGRPTQTMSALIDAWNEDMADRVEQACAEHIKETLAERMEAMKEALKASNDEYEKYAKE